MPQGERSPAGRVHRVAALFVIIAVTGILVTAGVGAAYACLVSGNVAWIRRFFDYPGALWLVTLSVVELWYALAARRLFSPGEPLRAAWSLIAMAAACHLASGILIQVLSQDSLINPLRYSGDLTVLRQLGLLIGGPLQMALLACGLVYPIRAYRRFGMLAGFRGLDWVLLAWVVCFAVRECADVARAVSGGRAVTAYEAINLVTAPLLAVLLLEAILIRRSVLNMGSGLVGKCWGAYTAAVFLTSLGDMGLWASTHSDLAAPLASVIWYIWFLAGSAYALAPAFQCEAGRLAANTVGLERRRDRPRDLAGAGLDSATLG